MSSGLVAFIRYSTISLIPIKRKQKYLLHLPEVIWSCNWARNYKVAGDLTCFEDGGQSSTPVAVTVKS